MTPVAGRLRSANRLRLRRGSRDADSDGDAHLPGDRPGPLRRAVRRRAAPAEGRARPDCAFRGSPRPATSATTVGPTSSPTGSSCVSEPRRRPRRLRPRRWPPARSCSPTSPLAVSGTGTCRCLFEPWPTSGAERVSPTSTQHASRTRAARAPTSTGSVVSTSSTVPMANGSVNCSKKSSGIDRATWTSWWASPSARRLKRSAASGAGTRQWTSTGRSHELAHLVPLERRLRPEVGLDHDSRALGRQPPQQLHRRDRRAVGRTRAGRHPRDRVRRTATP